MITQRNMQKLYRRKKSQMIEQRKKKKDFKSMLSLIKLKKI